ncbi:MAG: undecaprenyl diphosphate synthase family protein [Methanolinea sp.]|nr:undecaprenyl diphosphate synthase family protein [Methanolinea sp.]
MIRWLYERHLLSRIETLPSHVCFMITGQEAKDAPHKIVEVTRWCADVSLTVQEAARRAGRPHGGTQIEGVTFHISTPDPREILPLFTVFEEISRFALLVLHWNDETRASGTGMPVSIAVGKSGREEIAECIRRIAAEGIPPSQVTEKTIEEHLTFRYTPDLVIKTGGSHLTDFLIWQSVYSELFFSDVNWIFFRKTDFLRALRDYQSRVRRFGR